MTKKFLITVDIPEEFQPSYEDRFYEKLESDQVYLIVDGDDFPVSEIVGLVLSEEEKVSF